MGDNVIDFGIEMATLVGYQQGIDDLWSECEQMHLDCITETDAEDLPSEPYAAFCLGVLEMERKILELARIRKSEANTRATEICTEVNKRCAQEGEDND